nr:hypothetical protein Itr_chr01CG18340 [Ipomoea trifida]
MNFKYPGGSEFSRQDELKAPPALLGAALPRFSFSLGLAVSEKFSGPEEKSGVRESEIVADEESSSESPLPPAPEKKSSISLGFLPLSKHTIASSSSVSSSSSSVSSSSSSLALILKLLKPCAFSGN